jgi:hypothetical protein
VIRRLALGLVIFLITAEAIALAVFYWDTGNLFYLYRKPYEPLSDVEQQQLANEGLHPYFGPTHKPGLPFDIPESLRPAGGPAAPVRTNNFGFVSPRDYPWAKTNDDQFVVGLFGGSVGVWFCQVGAPRLIEELRRDPRHADREIVPLCFSHEGYKQPQQLQVLSYFLSLGQPFDLVVNIDGFNEVALGSINQQHGVDISMPSAQHVEPLVNLVNRATLTPAKLQTLAAIARDKETLRRLMERMATTRLAVVNFVLEQRYRAVRSRYQQSLVTFAGLPSAPADASLIQVTRPTRPRADDTLFDEIAANWSRASVLMRDLAAAHGAAYVHVLQPNQYATARRFGADEARVALNQRSPFKAGAERGYPKLTAAGRTLSERGVTFVDGTGIFDAEPAPVYIDDCCHYTRRGYELLADSIARAASGSNGR